jgi:uncharacterized protein YndB with AHSA1/START domain
VEPNPSEYASFDSRYTMRYVRLLPQAIERVWQAVTDAEQLNLWLMPVTEVDPRLGGRCRFSWGGPREDGTDGEVLVFEPPRRVRYETDAGAIEFLLEPHPEGTRFTFLQLFDADYRADPMADLPGGGLAAGPETPWRPGFLAGFHLAFEGLRTFLAMDLPADRISKGSRHVVELANGGAKERQKHDSYGPWARLCEIYEDIIREQCPPE